MTWIMKDIAALQSIVIVYAILKLNYHCKLLIFNANSCKPHSRMPGWNICGEKMQFRDEFFMVWKLFRCRAEKLSNYFTWLSSWGHWDHLKAIEYLKLYLWKLGSTRMKNIFSYFFNLHIYKKKFPDPKTWS